MSAPTPRPWHAPGMGEIHCCHDDDGHTDHTGHATSRYVRVHAPGAMCEDTDEIIVADGCTDADADLIVRAVNAHDALVAALRLYEDDHRLAARQEAEAMSGLPSDPALRCDCPICAGARRALSEPTTPRRSEP